MSITPTRLPSGDGPDPKIVDHRLEDWRRRLIDLSYRNRLIKYRHLRASSLEITAPDLDVLLADPNRTTPWNFYFPPDPGGEERDADATQTETLIDEAVLTRARAARSPRADEIIVADTHPKRITRTLENLARKSNAEYQDKALRVLYIAAGFLEWTDPMRDERLRSPLALIPVRLQRQSAASPYQLFFVDDEDPVINPSLTEKLRHDTDLDLPDDFAWEDKPILTELDEIQAAVAARGWTVSHDAVLGLFSFQKYVMYRDLLDNERIIARHPMVRSLAEKRLADDAQFVAHVPELADLDEQQPSRNTFSILDADASQRRCIEAAKLGQSFVMHGPPGTGKSQTIANIIAEAISQGRTVLFVSEKAAALDVVHNRLRSRGLDDFCLMLHGDHARRREVVTALHASLTSELVPRLALSELELRRHDNLRKYLNEQIASLHSPEPILGNLTLRELYARLAALHDAVSIPGAPPARESDGDAVINELEELRDTFGRLAERWSVSAPGYAWRDFDATRFSSDDRARVAQTVTRLQQATVAVLQSAEIAAGRLGWPEAACVNDVAALTTLSAHLVQRPVLATHWLQADAPREIRRASADAQTAYRDQDDGARELGRMYVGRSLDDFRADIATVLERAMRSLDEEAGTTPRVDDELLGALPGVIDALDELPQRCELTQRRLSDLCERLGQPDHDATFARIAELVRLGRLAFDPPGRPQSDWLMRAGLQRATSALAEARPLLEDYQHRRATVLKVWRPAVFDADPLRLSARYASVAQDRRELLAEWQIEALDLEVSETTARWKRSEDERAALLASWNHQALTEDATALAQRFGGIHTTRLAKAKSEYRRDAKRVKELRRDARLPESPAADLARLVTWQQDRRSLTQLIRELRVDHQLPDGMPGVLAPIAHVQRATSELADFTTPLLLLEGQTPAEVEHWLQDIEDVRKLGAQIDEHPAWPIAFGDHWKGRDSNASVIAAGCDAAAQALGLLSPETDTAVLAGELCVGASADPRLAQIADQLESSSDALLATVRRVAPFAAEAVVEPSRDSVNDVAHLAQRLGPPFHNVRVLADDLRRGAIQAPRHLDGLAEIATAISELHSTRAAIRASEEDWAATIGPAFDAQRTDWAALDLAARWLEELFCLVPTLTPRIQEQLLTPESARWPDPSTLKDALERYQRAAEDLTDLFAEPRRTQIINATKHDDLSFVEQQCTELLGTVDTLYDWTDYRHYRQRARDAGWDEFVTNLIDNGVEADEIPPAFERAFWGRRLDGLFNEEPELEEDFRGGSYERFISDFQQLDTRLVRTGPDRLISRRNATMPRHIAISNSEVAVLRTEAGKLRRHKPVRHLLAEIPALLTQLKPCLMMSPLSVSHYLTPSHKFDLVLFDEASQVPPQDAINCIYRGDQLIVAGDSHQLPPTSFFQVAELGDGGDDDSAEEDMESVLDSCQALLPEYYLRWHYRSRHEDLIAFSNDQIYKGELVTFPTPNHLSPDMGVAMTVVPDAIYERGRSQTNPVEARAVAHRLIDYLRDGSGRSVGVIAFNAAQAGAISSELDLKRVQDPSIDAYFSGDRLDGPFVKHLESVQGDERDVILFSIGYGHDADGKFPMSFGPLNKTGGHRRLNVAVTRARQKVEIIASVTAADFNLGDGASRGARLLRDYLAYAEQSGRHQTLSELGDDEHFAVTDIERGIATEIERLGYQVVHQLGAGFMRIDLAVVDPNNSDRFVLAIESDGPLYRITSTARDRDRLRDQVLADLGWRLHRIWSLDWLRDRAGQIERLRQALNSSCANDATAVDESTDTDEGDDVAPHRVDRVVVDLRDPATIFELPWVAPYVRQEVPYQHADFYEPSSRYRQTELAHQILQTEAPVQIDYLVRRLAEAYGLQRVGTRVDAAAREAIAAASRTYSYALRGQFVWGRAEQEVDVVRRPVDGDPRTRREIEAIPWPEIDLAFRRLLELVSGADDENLLVAAARILGFERTGERVREVLSRRLRAAKRMPGA